MEGIVAQTIENNSTEIYAIEFSGTPSHPETFTIHSTAGHPFWVENLQAWQDASALEPGMQILLVDGSTVNVIANNKTRTQSRVYNFSVHQYENYFAGDLGVLVHNCKVIGRSGKQQQLRKLASDPKLSKSLRGEIQRDINEINRGKRPTIRVPQGYNLAHKRGFEARKGYDYSYSHLNTVELHNL